MGFKKDLKNLKKNKEVLIDEFYQGILARYQSETSEKFSNIKDIERFVRDKANEIGKVEKRNAIKIKDKMGNSDFAFFSGFSPIFAALTFSGVLKFVEKRQKEIHSEEINQAVLEYTTPKAEELNAKFPDILNVTPDGLAQQLKAIYDSSYAFTGFGNHIVKPGYEGFVIEYKNTNGFGVEDAITDITHEITNFTETLCFGIGSAALVALCCFTPVIINKRRRAQIGAYINELLDCMDIAEIKSIDYIKKDCNIEDECLQK